VDLHHPALKLPHVPNILQVTGKDHHGKRAETKIIAEVQKVNSPRALLDPHHHAGYAFDLANMSSGFGHG
jgi:hypothetical protein